MKRNVTWFKPPFNLKSRTNVGKVFLEIVRESFKTDHPLRKIFNSNTLKISYSCISNVKNIIDGHNEKNMKEKTEEKKECNCRRRQDCPLDGNCKKSGVI